jgi:hypothetical protein
LLQGVPGLLIPRLQEGFCVSKRAADKAHAILGLADGGLAIGLDARQALFLRPC